MRKSRILESITDQTAQFYDREAEAYDGKRWGSPSGSRLNRFQINLVVAMLNPVRGNKVLEVGTGTGRFAAALAGKGADVTGVDISEGMLREAEKQCAAITYDFPPKFIQSDVDSLPFPDTMFDSVFCINVFQLFESLQDALAEIYRVTKPGGRFLFNFPNIVSPYVVGGILVNWRGTATGKNEAGRRKSHWFTLNAIQLLIRESLFEIEEIRGQPFIPGNRGLGAFRYGIKHPRCLCPSLFLSCRRANG